MSASKVPVVVLQYGKFDLTKRCLESLRSQSVPVEIILVDGNSPGKDSKTLEELAAAADRSIFLDSNLGYAGANNKAIDEVVAEGSSEFVFIVNNDTVVDRDCLEGLLAAMKKYPHAAQVVPQVLYPEGLLQAAGGEVAMPIFEPRLIGHLGDAVRYAEEAEVDYAPGMAVLVRVSAIKEVGAIPEEYFMYGEDVDWSYRFRKAGWQIRFYPPSKITHHDSASIGGYSQIKGYYLTRANVWLARKWLSSSDFNRFRWLFINKLLRQSVKHLARPGYIIGMWRGYIDGVKR